MKIWKIVFHSILEIFHSGIFHIPYRNFRSIPFSIPYHALCMCQTQILLVVILHNLHQMIHCILWVTVISGGSRKFWWGGIWSQNLKNSDVFTKVESDFSAEIGNSNVFFAQNQVVSKKKKKKKVLTKIETDFSAGFVTFRSVGEDASRNGAEFIQNRGWFFGQNRNF